MRNYNSAYELRVSTGSLSILSHWASEGEITYGPYQRGEVWSPQRKVNLIRSLTLGIPIGNLVVNDRLRTDWEDETGATDFAIIDGRQRAETIMSFFAGDLAVPGHLFGEAAEEVTFSELPMGTKRRFKRENLQIAYAAVSSLKAEEEIFNLINFGGVPQGEVDSYDLDKPPRSFEDLEVGQKFLLVGSVSNPFAVESVSLVKSGRAYLYFESDEWSNKYKSPKSSKDWRRVDAGGYTNCQYLFDDEWHVIREFARTHVEAALSRYPESGAPRISFSQLTRAAQALGLGDDIQNILEDAANKLGMEYERCRLGA